MTNRINIKLYIFLFLIFNCFSLLSANRQVITVGIQADAPPFEYISNEKTIGFNIDILNAISKRLPVEFKFVQKSYSQLKSDLMSDKTDMILMMYKSDENLSNFQLSKTYNKLSISVFHHASISFANTPIDQYELLTDIPEIYELINKSLVGNCVVVSEKIRRSFFSKQTDNDTTFFILPEKTGLHLIEKNGLQNIWSYPVSNLSIEYGFGFNKNNDSLFMSINESLEYLLNSDEYIAIQQKWFGYVDPNIALKPTSLNPIYKYLFIISVVLFVIVAYTMFKQNKKLKNRLKTEIQNKIEAENNLDEIECYLNQTIDAINHPLFIQNSNGEFILFNNTFVNLIGLIKDDCTNDKINEALKRDDQLKKLLLAENETSAKQKVISANGQLHIFEISKTTFQKPDNQSILLTFALDITKRDRAERRLEHESALLSSIINSIPDYIFYKDNLLRYIGANTAFKKHYNLSDEELIGKTDFELFDIKQAIDYHKNNKKIIESNEPIRFERWVILPNGKSALLDTLVVPFHNIDGETLGIVGISRDVTRQYEIQKELKNAKTKAEEGDRLKTMFLTNISHEIRSALNSIIGFSDLLLDPELSLSQKENFVEMIRSSSNSLIQLIDNIINLSAIESGQVVINQSETKLSIIFDDLTSHYEKIIEDPIFNDVKLVNKYTVTEEEPSYYIDGFRTKQILSNLIETSIKLTRKGKILIGADIKEKYIEFFIDNRNAIIDRFLLEDIFQTSEFNEGIENYSSLDLNIIITQGLINAMKGDFSINRSKTDTGIKLSFTIPIDQSKQKATEDYLNNDNNDLSNKTILIAEDDENNYLFIEEVLRKTKIKTIWALNGKEALEHILTNKDIDIVLMDIRMPVMDGYTATREIKKIRPDIPIIVQTAYAAEEEKSKSFEAGCNAYLAKPISSMALLKTISEFL
ncbi:MAG: response regulator [Salinivirgaceae bacterium]|jgi:PAS domain S-box-containing protein